MFQDLPLEVWESILAFCEESELQQLRSVSKAWKTHIDTRIVPNMLIAGDYTIPSVSILLFNGFHQYRSEQKLKYDGIQWQIYNINNETLSNYASFIIVDPLRYFKLNRMEDVDNVNLLRIARDTAGNDMGLRECVTIPKHQLQKHALIGSDDQSILIPLFLMTRDDWEIDVPEEAAVASYMGAVAVSLYGMGVPDQTWTTSFSSGQNLPY